jgi:hypothetical protein
MYIAIICLFSENSMVFLTGITAIVLVFYTGETYRLRKESQKQTLKSFTPYLTMIKVDNQIYLKNVGQGIARNIRFTWPFKSGEKILNILAIGAGESEKLYLSRKVNDQEHVSSVYYPTLSEGLIFIEYFDMLENKYNCGFMKSVETKNGFIETIQKIPEKQ